MLKSNWKGEPTKNKWIVTSYEAKGEKGSSISSEPLTKGDDLPLNSAKDSTTKDAQSQIDPIKMQTNAHIGSGILGGMAAGIEQDENGNYTFNPQNFILGFLGGAAASKATQAAFKNPKIKAKAQSFAKVAFEKSKAILQDSNLGECVQEQLAYTFGKGLTKALDARTFMQNPAKAANQIKNTLEKEVKDIYDHIDDLNKWFKDMDIHRVDWDLIQKERTRLESNLNEIMPKYEAANKALDDAINNRAQTTGFRYESDIRKLKQEQKGILTSEQEESVKRFYELETQIESLREAYYPLIKQKDDAERLFEIFKDRAEELRIKSAIAKLKTLDEMEAFAEQEISKLRAQRKSYLPEADTKALENELKETRDELFNIGLNNRKIKEWRKAQGGILTKEQEAKANRLRFLREQEKKLESKISSMRYGVERQNDKIAKHNKDIRDKINFIFDEMPTMLSAERRGFDEEVEQNVKELLENGYTQEQINALKSKAYDRNIRAQEILENYDTGATGRGYDGYSMSNNARDAYSHNIKPLSKWNKEDADAFSELLGAKISLKELKELLKKHGTKGWHHTSMHYNKTDFYSLAEAVLYGREWLESRFGKDVFVKGAKGASGGKELKSTIQKPLSKDEILETISKWDLNAPNKQKLLIAKVEGAELEQLKKEFDFKGNYEIAREIDSDKIAHTLKQHGDQAREAERGQVAVGLDDIANYENIVKNYDLRVVQDNNRILYAKQVNGFYAVIEEVLTGRNKLAYFDMWKGAGKLNKEVLLSHSQRPSTSANHIPPADMPSKTGRDSTIKDPKSQINPIKMQANAQNLAYSTNKANNTLSFIKSQDKIKQMQEGEDISKLILENDARLNTLMNYFKDSLGIQQANKEYAKNLLKWQKNNSLFTRYTTGEPKVFYHGSKAGIESFNTNNNIGFFFTTNASEADFYTKEHFKKKGIYKVFLSAKNPFRADLVDIANLKT